MPWGRFAVLCWKHGMSSAFSGCHGKWVAPYLRWRCQEPCSEAGKEHEPSGEEIQPPWGASSLPGPLAPQIPAEPRFSKQPFLQTWAPSRLERQGYCMWHAGLSSWRLPRAESLVLGASCSTVGSAKSATVGAFPPWKWASSAHQWGSVPWEPVYRHGMVRVPPLGTDGLPSRWEDSSPQSRLVREENKSNYQGCGSMYLGFCQAYRGPRISVPEPWELASQNSLSQPSA